MVNGQLLCRVIRTQMTQINAVRTVETQLIASLLQHVPLSFRTPPLCHSERSEESRGEKEEIHRFALNDKRPNAEEHPPSPPSKGEKRSEGGMLSLQRGEERKRSVGEKAISPLGGL